MITIRAQTTADHDAIDALTYAAFENHPHHAPGATPTEHLIIRRLRAAGSLDLSLVAEINGQIVGHIAFSAVTISGENKHWYGLGPVSVCRKYQHKGIGSTLIRAGLAEYKSQGAKGIVLLGEPAYYARFGFKANPSLTFSGVPPEYFLSLSLDETKTRPTGDVTYHPAFFE